ncbi:MAG: hypothetical protein JNM27_18915 [Leptospirales bacterium]|nr:hypothetical protein [Leptospirales bacterium]
MSHVSGVLRPNGNRPYIEGPDGARHFEGERIWDGYLTHWADREVNARTLPQKDYETDRPIVLIWPRAEESAPCVELYYNEKLSQYWESMMGHIALNVNGLIFNFSNLLNENEIITPEEYFFRPALGEFAPLPGKGKWGFDEAKRPYFDKFGRLFMRSIHVLRIEGLDLAAMEKHLRASLETIHNSPRDPKHPENYAQFSVTRRSCATFSRDGLRAGGLKFVAGIMPRDLFVSAAHAVRKQQLKSTIYKLNQLVVPECPVSAPTRLTNIRNYFRANLRYDPSPVT